MSQVEEGKCTGRYSSLPAEGCQRFSLLQCAASSGHAQAVEALLQAGGDALYAAMSTHVWICIQLHSVALNGTGAIESRPGSLC